jgi:succinate dehydrogenase / fumarate reductase cytochrome b subunit
MTTAAKTRTVTDKPAKAAPGEPARRRLSDFACKQVMAVTGIVFGLYVLVHMLGNLKAYLGPEEFGNYAVWLRRMLEPAAPYSSVLWVFRVVLLGCLVGHVTCATILFFRARAARGPFEAR